ncbi:hypothetical protein [uncultured Corynebacterium sp.]|uniref:hypothetical protein n=1 Tax=uncultured Corynebacterium sp. TaxID=159447 RepID=UPI0025FA904F|nr:hypothetical protein [uncultured Corynebacterium sp.]
MEILAFCAAAVSVDAVKGTRVDAVKGTRVDGLEGMRERCAGMGSESAASGTKGIDRGALRFTEG